MVRIKHRYLLVNILYPDRAPPPSKTLSQLPPSFLHFHQPSPNALTAPVLLRAIRDQVAYLYGDYGAGVTAAGLNIKYLSPATSTFILRCPRAHFQLVWAALTYMTHLPPLAITATDSNVTSQSTSFDRSRTAKQPPRACVMRVVRVSGTIRKAEEEAIRRARADVLRARRGDEGSGLGTLLGSGGGKEGEGEGIVDRDEDKDKEDGEDDDEDTGENDDEEDQDG